MRVTKAIKAEQLKLLQEHYFDAKPALEYTNEFELLVAVVLSAQCTDERVNIVTKRLFPELNHPANNTTGKCHGSLINSLNYLV